jgi:hypothetical protein
MDKGEFMIGILESIVEWTLDRVADIVLPAELFFSEFEEDEI